MKNKVKIGALAGMTAWLAFAGVALAQGRMMDIRDNRGYVQGSPGGMMQRGVPQGGDRRDDFRPPMMNGRLGNVVSVNGSSFIIQPRAGMMASSTTSAKSQNVTTDSNTIFAKMGQKASLSDVTVGVTVMVQGRLSTTTNSILAKRVDIMPASPRGWSATSTPPRGPEGRGDNEGDRGSPRQNSGQGVRNVFNNMFNGFGNMFSRIFGR